MRRHAPRGQNLVLFSLTMLLLTLMVCLTLSIGAKVKDKMEMDQVADAAAYSNAVATARAFNTVSLLNRTMISHWTTLAGVQALTSWASMYKAYMAAFAVAMREFDSIPSVAQMDKLGCNASQCDQNYYWGGTAGPCGNFIRPASYAFIHADMWSMHIGKGNVMNDAQIIPNYNSTPYDMAVLTAAIDVFPSNYPGWGKLETDVATESDRIRNSIRRLKNVEKQVYRKLRTDIRGQQYLNQFAAMANPKFKAPLTLSSKAAPTNWDVAWREVSGTLYESPSLNPNEPNAAGNEFNHTFWEAAMGTRGNALLVQDAYNKVLGNPVKMMVPPRVVQAINAIQSRLDAAMGPPPGGVKNSDGKKSRFGFYVAKPPTGNGSSATLDVAAYWSKGSLSDETDPDPSARAQQDWGDAMGHAQGEIYTEYFSCSSNKWIRSWQHTYFTHTAKTYLGDHMSGGIPGYHNYNGHWDNENSAHQTPGAETSPNGGLESCHLNHSSPTEVSGDVAHDLENQGNYDPDDPSYPGGIGMVFPQDGDDNGAGGFGGQPKLPALLARSYATPKENPWDLTVNFRFTPAGQKLKIGTPDSPELQAAVAVSNGVVYYHRREHEAEAANMLNPFWRATLAPIDLDEQGRLNANVNGKGKRNPDMVRLLQGADAKVAGASFTEAETAYTGLKKLGFQGTP